MRSQAAYEAMKNGHKIAHNYFSPSEYYELKGEEIIAEDGVNHTAAFFNNSGSSAWRADGWEIYTDLPMTQREVIDLMKSSKSLREWNANCDIIKKSLGGYPDYWYASIVGDGIYDAAKAKWE